MEPAPKFMNQNSRTGSSRKPVQTIKNRELGSMSAVKALYALNANSSSC